MKMCLIPFVFLLAIGFQKLNAQDYFPMDTITDWKIESAFFGDSWHYWYTYEGDTVINGKTYRVINNHELEEYDIDILHYFRENRMTRKVYKYIPQEDAEILYYDFSLDIGDDFYVAESDSYFTVIAIDTVDSEIGPLRRWRLDDDNLYFTYTEAIGGQVPDYQYWIYVQDPTHDVACAYHYCDNIFTSGNCEPYPSHLDTTLLNAFFCEGDTYILPDGSPTNEPGIYEYTYSSSNGCDSAVFLTLHALRTDLVVIDTTICVGDIFVDDGGFFVNQYGCDSVVAYMLTVEPLQSRIENYELCPGEEVYGLSANGVYTIILPSENGCDTILTVEIVQLHEGDPACITSTIDHSFDYVKIFPTPASDQLHIETGNQSFELDIIHFTGLSIEKGLHLAAGSNSINTSQLVPGIYLLKMNSASGTRYYTLIRQ